MASLKRKLEGDIDIRVAGGDAFHEIFASRPHHISNVNPQFVQGCDLHDGFFGKPGSKICWRYTLDGKALTCKQIIDVVDEENKLMKFTCIEGSDLLNDYKTFVITYQVIPTGGDTHTVTWIFEYEKMHPGIPEPTTLMDALVGLAEEIDVHHHSQAAEAN